MYRNFSAQGDLFILFPVYSHSATQSLGLFKCESKSSHTTRLSYVPLAFSSIILLWISFISLSESCNMTLFLSII